MFYRIRCILRILLLLITGCSEGCSMIWQVTSSFLSRKSKIGFKIASKESFFRDGIRKLSERWEKVVVDSSDGQYFNWSFILFWNKCIFEHKKTDRTNLYSQYYARVCASRLTFIEIMSNEKRISYKNPILEKYCIRKREIL